MQSPDWIQIVCPSPTDLSKGSKSILPPSSISCPKSARKTKAPPFGVGCTSMSQTLATPPQHGTGGAFQTYVSDWTTDLVATSNIINLN